MKISLVSMPVQNPIKAHEIHTSTLGFVSKEFDAGANLSIMVFAVKNVEPELERLKAAGVKVRPELEKPDWGIKNMFEGGCGNILMIEEIPA